MRSLRLSGALMPIAVLLGVGLGVGWRVSLWLRWGGVHQVQRGGFGVHDRRPDLLVRLGHRHPVEPDLENLQIRLPVNAADQRLDTWSEEPGTQDDLHRVLRAENLPEMLSLPALEIAHHPLKALE